MMLGKKEIDGRYYVRGYVNSSPIQRNVYIQFLVDTSQKYTTISKPDAEKNKINLEKLEVRNGLFEIRNERVNAYEIPTCEIHIPNQHGRPNYTITLPRVYVPFKKISANSLEADVSRLGLDFLEFCTISFLTGDLERDQAMILEKNPAVNA